MAIFDDTAKTEIKRLERIIAKLEATKGVRIVTVEMVWQSGYGYLFYISAPTTANEKEFGLALAETIERSLKVIKVPGIELDRGLVREIDEPPSDHEIALERSLFKPQKDKS